MGILKDNKIIGIVPEIDYNTESNVSNSLPAGGSIGQVLAKASQMDGDVTWTSAGGGGGGVGTVVSINSVSPDGAGNVVITQDNVPDGTTNKRYSNTEKTKLGNITGTNTGDETTATIKTKLGAGSTSADGYITSADWSTFNGKQAPLTSGSNIKTINGTSVLGSGDIVISGGGASTSKVKASATDTTEGYLGDKIVAGTNVTVTKNNAGGNETYTIASTGGGGSGVTVYADVTAIKAVDTTALTSGTLAQVVTLGQYVFVSTSTGTGDDNNVIAPTVGSGRWKKQASIDTPLTNVATTKSSTFGIAKHTQILENSETKELAILPLALASQKITRKIVTIGDSNMAGQGVTDKTTRYIYQLKTYLEANKGYVVKDMALGGNTTTAMADRFHIDIAPEKPDLVIISTSIINRGFSSGTGDTAIQAGLGNEKIQIFKMIQLCKSIKADYLIVGAYPAGVVSSKSYEYILKFNTMMQMLLGDKYINIYGILDSGTGTLGSLFDSGDATHFNLAGHNAIYALLKKLDFDKYGISPDYLLMNKNCKGVTLPNDTTSGTGMYISSPLLFAMPSLEVSSGFTLGFEVSPNPSQSTDTNLANIQGASGQQGVDIFLDVNKYLNIRFKNIGGATTTILTTSVRLVEKFPNKLRLTYNPSIKKFTLILNGIVIGNSSVLSEEFSNANNYGGVYIGCSLPATKNAVGFSYRHIFTYRTSLTLSDVLEIDNGKLSCGGLSFYNPIDGVASVYMNYAISGAYINASVWEATLTSGAFSNNDYVDADKLKLATINTVGTAVASATTIVAPSTIFHVTGTTAISTITVPYIGFTGQITIIPDAIFTLATGGNIAEAYTAVVNRAIVLTYDGTSWYRVNN